ncbi:hypothetical protein DL98DRAFT_583006 [Cadophora sp. DSE1049]|nr:hypothetical protein DL98DRAFT_583006 [Cadophora sp. DSE1049]
MKTPLLGSSLISALASFVGSRRLLHRFSASFHPKPALTILKESSLALPRVGRALCTGSTKWSFWRMRGEGWSGDGYEALSLPPLTASTTDVNEVGDTLFIPADESGGEGMDIEGERNGEKVAKKLKASLSLS